MHKKLHVRLFKQSEKHREQQAVVETKRKLMLAGTSPGQIDMAVLSQNAVSVASKHHDPSKNLIKELIVTEENGQLNYKPKNPNNSLRFMHAAHFEIDHIEKEHRKLSQVEKNRIFLKFVDMNEQPKKYSHYQHYKEGKQRKV